VSGKQQHDNHTVYQIRVRGILDGKWSDWFDGMQISPQAGGDTVMSGPVVDQAALHGLLNKIRDVGLPLVALNIVDINADE
jgi:hypothetical protein